MLRHEKRRPGHDRSRCSEWLSQNFHGTESARAHGFTILEIEQHVDRIGNTLFEHTFGHGTDSIDKAITPLVSDKNLRSLLRFVLADIARGNAGPRNHALSLGNFYEWILLQCLENHLPLPASHCDDNPVERCLDNRALECEFCRFELGSRLLDPRLGIGLGTELSLNGTAAHAFCHILYKALLFMTMGAVLYRTGTTKATELGGLYKSMPITAALTTVGAASISAFPLFSGFVSKSMVMTAALQEGHSGIWLALLFASAGVFHHAGIKIPFFAFFAHDSGIRVKEAPWNMLIAMGAGAAICVLLGILPAPL